MIIRRIRPVLQKHHVLQPNRYGLIPGKGTASELIQLLNILEEVAEHNLEVDLSTADVSAAFDSPERTVQWACWRRVGIPPHVATYLACLGALSKYQLNSPYGQRNNPIATAETADTDMPFHPQRGCT